MTQRRSIGVFAAGLLVGLGTCGLALSPLTSPQEPPQGGMPDLPGAIRDSPGCLGIETGEMSSGKQSIFAWFEDKAAVMEWYSSETHRGVMKTLASGYNVNRPPLEMVDDDEGPILVIATLTMADRPHFESMPNLPISQISIELYKPLPGGAYLGARFAPDGVKVENMRNYTPDE